ncbi:MAG: hypothetical protein OEW58_02840 [Gammaproteobacteria bacterium]|nr:hypothetical protein [Gammaproteobacteria bacterium]
MRLVMILLLLLTLTGCPGNAVVSPAQEWEGMIFQIETRPPIVEPGMIEFLVVADRGKRRAEDLFVNLRIGSSGRWTQAIQDGHVGVYRRAVLVNDPLQDELNVYVRWQGKETVLVFPLDFAVPK